MDTFEPNSQTDISDKCGFLVSFYDKISTFVWKVYTKVFSFFVVLWRLQKYSYEERFQRVFLYLISFVVSLLILCILLFILVSYKNKFNQLRDGCLASFVLSGVSILLILRLFINYYQVYIFLFNSILFSALLVVHHVSEYQIEEGGGTMEGQIISLGFILIVFVLAFGNTFQRIFWSIVFWLGYFSCFVRDLLCVDVYVWAEWKNRVLGTSSSLIVFYQYVAFLIPMITYILTLLVLKINNYRQKKIIGVVGKGILELDLNSKAIRKFEMKEEIFSTDFELLLQKIIFNLKIYKKFLPDSIKLQNWDFYSSSSSKDTDSATSSDLSDATVDSNQSSVRSNVSLDGKRPINKIIRVHYGIRKETEFCMMKVAMVGMDDFYDDADEDECMKTASSFIDLCSSIVYAFNGAVDSFDGSTVTASFNTQKKCINFPIAACECAFAMTKRVMKSLEIKVQVSILYSKAPLGNVATTLHSRFLILGWPHEMLYEMDKTNRRLSNGMESIFVDDVIYETVRYIFVGKGVELIKLRGRNKKIGIYKLVAQRKIKGTGQEWLYEIGDMLKEPTVASSFRIMYNNIFGMIKKGDFDAASTLVETYVRKNEGDTDASFLREKIIRKERYREV